MSWLNQLHTTYVNCEAVVGAGENPLLPIAHSTQNAQIEVTINDRGEFKNARIIDKSDAVTIIPVTEDSASRSGIFPPPHPLFDKLQYLAGDYSKFTEDDKGKEFFEKYIQQLEGWCNSSYSNQKVCAILAYLKKESLISDLVEETLLKCREDGKLDAAVKLDVGSQCDAFVRFRVNYGDDKEPRAWMDNEVQDSFIQYYLSLQKTLDRCYASGEEMPCSEKHPSKIRNTADKAKLISGNDGTGFTYRGRFAEKNQAVSIGYETSQKAHNALKWLVDKQGYKNYEQVIVAWGTKGQKLPPVSEDTYELFADEDRNTCPSTSEDFAKRLSNAIAGYKCDLDNRAEIVVMGLDSATTGRLSITYYRELNGSDFLERIQYWHDTCFWQHTYKSITEGVDEKGKLRYKQIAFVGAPSPRDMAVAAFGAKASDKLLKATVERLLPCIIDKALPPYDVIKAMVNRALKPVSMEWFEWEKIRSITCALVKKYRLERFKEEWKMELDDTVVDIHYLCGRLLAIADEIEGWALKEMREPRETNAIRLFEHFAQNPSKTWGILVKRLIPYQSKLGKMGKSYEWLLDLREDVSKRIDPTEFHEARNLDGRFILGFDCQKREIRDEIKRRSEAKSARKKVDSIENEGEEE